ncbi:MAG: NAD(P)-binding protein, partial [Desulfobulbia bacterium]
CLGPGMTVKLNITRRDFLNGIALGIAGFGALSPLEIFALQGKTPPGYYPPSLTGMRGNHAGSFEVAHAVARNGARFPRPDVQTDRTYDLIILGGGISGLSAASLYRDKVGTDARILVLDNHDDFGGHAKRNEFEVDGSRLIGYGGSQSIDSPARYSGAASNLIKDIGIDTQRFYEYFDRSYFSGRKLKRGIYFSREAYGSDRVRDSILRSSGQIDVEEIINSYPLSDRSKQDLIRLMQADTDYLAGKTREEKVNYLRRVSYLDFLRNTAGASEEVALLLRDSIKGFWGFGWDALSAQEACRMGMPGTYHLGLGENASNGPDRDEPYIFHFPDGNASVARLLVRQLIPQTVPGDTMEDLVQSRVDYTVLDRETNNIRIRLNSTGVDVRHAAGGQFVDVTYVCAGQSYRVRGKHVILACYNNIIPHICPEVPATQAEAIAIAEKIPLVYISIAVRNWKAFENLGYRSFYIPQGKRMHSFGMDFPVSMGGYRYTQSSDQPTVVHGTYCPTEPGQGLTEREQHVAGRRQLYELSFADLERDIFRQMSGALERGGFDAQRDVAALTINRWPHGYAYEYNELYDPPEWTRESGPHLAGAAQMGRISIANSDASAYAYVDGAIDAADRAVNEQLALA